MPAQTNELRLLEECSKLEENISRWRNPDAQMIPNVIAVPSPIYSANSDHIRAMGDGRTRITAKLVERPKGYDLELIFMMAASSLSSSNNESSLLTY